MRKWNILLIGCVLVWMSVIFFLSNRSATYSREDSYHVAKFIGEIFVPNFEKLSAAQQKDFVIKIQYPLRKTAHFVEYLILGALLSGAFWKQRNHLKDTILALGCGVLFAISDEFHQTFIPGRVGHFCDILIDSAGTLTGVLLFLIFLFFKRKIMILQPLLKSPKTDEKH